MQQLLEKAAALHQQGNLQEALQLYQQAILLDPSNPVPYNLTAVAAGQIGRPDIAANMFARALEIQPGYAEAHYNFGNLLKRTAQYEKAIEHYNRVPSDNSLYLNAQNNLAAVMRALNREHEAIKIYRRVLELDSDYAEVWDNIGKSYIALGQMDEARKAFERAIGINPKLGDAHYNIIRMADGAVSDDHMLQMQQLCEAEDMPLKDRVSLLFALGAAFHKRKEYDTAFGYYQRANRLHRSTLGNELPDYNDFVRATKQSFASPPAGWSWEDGFPDETPIFILGMPRSGTTLVEQILASHPQVGEVGEQPIMANLTKQLRDQYITYSLRPEDRRMLGAEYVRRLREVGGDAPRLTPKMPDNYKLIGYIAMLLPKAKIVYCRRDPINTCLSMYFQHFSQNHPYSYDLVELAEYFHTHKELMQFWDQLLPGRLIEVSYEALVENFEPEVRRLLDACGLPWDDRCLEFYKTQRSVQTASDVQVRKPLFKSSLDTAAKYDAHLGPLKQALKL